MNNRMKEVIERVLVIFLIIQPLLDVYMAIVGENLDIFGISIATLIRTITSVVLVVTVGIYQIRNKYKIKWLVALLIYLLLVGIYATLHHYNIVLSGGYFITQGIYNTLVELMYVLRLVVPIILIYTVMLVKPKRDQIEKCIISVVFIISLVILFTNIFKISFTSYSSGTGMIEYNIFDWFTNEEIPYRLALSKGMFVSANQIGALLAILLPIVVMYAINNNKSFTYIVLLLGVISMLMIGTRVATYGFILVSIGMILCAIIIGLFRNKKIEYIRLLAIFVIMILGLVIYSKSPAKNRTFATDDEGMYYETLEEIMDTEEYMPIEEFKEILQDEDKIKEYVNANKKSTEDLRYEAICKYIKGNYIYHGITRKYIVDIYPYTEDPEFWLELFEEPFSVKGDNRARQSVIIKRIKELNNNYLYDTLVGMGATPMNPREYMIENDLISHYYNIGIVGIILFVAPYAAVIIYALVIVLGDIKKRLTLRLSAYILSIVMTYGVGYFAGHVIDEYIITIYVATISGLTLNYINEILGGKTNERDNA